MLQFKALETLGTFLLAMEFSGSVQEKLDSLNNRNQSPKVCFNFIFDIF